jgi:hypothetical protein
MGYLFRLINRATDTMFQLENNRIGNYRITPQHGNVLVYHIYKINDKARTSNHFCTITIDTELKTVNVGIVKAYQTTNDVEQLMDFFGNQYSEFDTNLENI